MYTLSGICNLLGNIMKEHNIKKTVLLSRVVIMKGSQSTLQSIFMINPLQKPSKSNNWLIN